MLRLKPQGFTLIELMIVVAIVGILSAIAVPNYLEYIRKSHRADAKAAMLRLQQMLERSYTDRGVYNVKQLGTGAGSLSLVPSPKTANVVIPEDLGFSSDRYQLEVGAMSPATPPALVLVTTDTGSPNYMIRATLRTGFVDKECKEFTITSIGTKAAKHTNGTDNTRECWR